MKNTNVTSKTRWSIDQAHSELAFKVRHLRITSVRGSFRTFDASIYTRGKDFTTAEIDLWIDASSISTGDAKRDEHLKSADFFDVETHKQISFTSISIGKTDKEGNHEMWGELTMRGITKNVMLMVQFGGIVNDPWGNEKAGFTVTGKVNRSDWGLVWTTAMEAGGIMVGEEVSITCEVELTNLGQEGLTMQLVPEVLMKLPTVKAL
ncbi:MAG: YceI family protein [Bacteroidota bacterium]